MRCNNSGLIRVHRKRQDNWYNYRMQSNKCCVRYIADKLVQTRPFKCLHYHHTSSHDPGWRWRLWSCTEHWMGMWSHSLQSAEPLHLCYICSLRSQLSSTSRLTVPVKSSVGDALIDVVGHSNAFLIVAVPPSLHSTTQPTPRRVGHSCTSPSHPKASNMQLEPALSRLSLLAHITLLYPFAPFPGLISPCRQCPGKQLPGCSQTFWQTCSWCPAASYEKEPHQDRKHKDIADTHTFWVADILVVSIDTDYNDK